MKILIDTHIAIWAVTGDPRLSLKANEMLSDCNNQIYYSAASIWELTIKHLLHPEQVIVDGKKLAESCEMAGFLPLSIANPHAFTLETLSRPENAPRHNDPFDRILLAQAKFEGMMFMTHDSLIPYYGEPCVLLV